MAFQMPESALLRDMEELETERGSQGYRTVMRKRPVTLIKFIQRTKAIARV